MSKKKNIRAHDSLPSEALAASADLKRLRRPAPPSSGRTVPEETKRRSERFIFYLKSHALSVAVVLALGSFGAALGYLAADARRQLERGALDGGRDASWLNKINPFLPTLPPAPALAKEYLYAGSRLLAVEDAGANAVPPADLAVWSPSSGVWRVMGPAGAQSLTAQWGTANDKPVPGDYDGDGKTDFSVFRPSNNNWYIIYSSTNATAQFPFGAAGDVPAQADFDGDGRTDAAVFRPSQTANGGAWYVLKSSDGQTLIQSFGASGDVPAPADYDGDGRADLTVWRSQAAAFYSIHSSDNGLRTISHGAAGDMPVGGDYDGDGRADFALRRGNQWLIRKSSNLEIENVSWQQAGDRAVPNDYDGDGKTDVAVWRDSNGTWYIRNSSNAATRTVQWGQSGDHPVPVYHRR